MCCEFNPGTHKTGSSAMRSVGLWLLGVPIGVIILLNLFHVI